MKAERQIGRGRVRRRPGRPMKFGRPSRAITVTLPEDVIDRLSQVDVDLGRAIVSVTERNRGAPAPRSRVNGAHISSYGSHAVILVPPVKKLGRLAGVELVPVGGGRALIALDGAYRIPELELAVRDAIDHDGLGGDERETFEALAQILREARRSGGVSLAERKIIVLQAKRRR